MLDSLLKKMPERSSVLDYGCWGWKVLHAAKRLGLSFAHHGCDFVTPRDVPESARFYKVDAAARTIPCEDDTFDLIVASHVIEHVADPLELFCELVRVCKPGGLLYVETPTDRAVHCKSDGNVETHSFYSFWDDPTHLRPWPPAALYRLALSYGCEPLECNYIGTLADKLAYPFRRIAAYLRKDPFAPTQLAWKANKWAGYAVIRKPFDLRGAPSYRYITLQSVAPGKVNAIAYSNALGKNS